MPVKELLRFTTAGSVDDGKSTLIGRLLYDSRAVYEDQLVSVRNSPVNRSSGPLDFSLLTDGLRAEREQGITIDVAYRYFATPARKFIIADTPGHEQYTRNMATGASTADLAVILIDAKNGVQPQSKRHACIASLLGIPRALVAINKMDLAGWREEVFEAIRAEFEPRLERLGFTEWRFIPISALEGDNVAVRSERAPWYRGESLLELLENAPAAARRDDEPFRLPVQYVLRPDHTFRGYAGQIAAGTLRPGDHVMALPSGRTSRVRAIPSFDGDLPEAVAPMSIAVQLEHDLDISRGDMLADPRRLPHVSRRFRAHVVWMHEQPLRPGRPCLLKHTTQQVTATFHQPLLRLDVDTLERTETDELALNEIGLLEIETSRPLFYDAYKANRATGSFILIDPLSNVTVGAGMIENPGGEDQTRRAAREAISGLEFQASRLTPAERFTRAGHHPAVVWLAARRDLAYLLEVKLFGRGCQVHVIAGEAESSILPELAQLLAAAGMIAIVSAPGVDSAECARARDAVGASRFIEIEPQKLSPGDEEAARQICLELERRGILPGLSVFGDGGGI